MDLSQLVVLSVFLGTILALIFSNQRPSTIFAAAMLGLIITQQLKFEDILSNLTNKGLITLVLLLLVSSAIDKTALIKRLGRKLITHSFSASYWRLFGLTFFSSALLNNTAIVASLIGPVKQNQFHPASRFLIPLSYAAILGGTVTLIGTSTNLIVDSFLQEHGHPGFAFWDFTLYGLIAGLTCGLLMFFLTPLLPNIQNKQNNFREYLLEADVEPHSELVGKSVEENHLRNLPELFLAEIIRDGQLISPVTPDLVIKEGDKLIFSGNVQKIDNLSHIRGLTTFAEADGIMRENLTEVLVANRAQVIGQTIKALGFRALFDAAVVAIRRDGEQLSGKLGEIKLKAGDFLLLATGPDFHSRHNLSKNFFVLSNQKIARPLNVKQEVIALGGFLITVGLAAINLVPLAIGLMFFAAALVAFKVVTNGELKRNLPLNLMVVIVGALSLATALENSGVIAKSTNFLLPYLSDTNWLVALAVIYVTTLLLTEFVTNNAAAALMFPFAYGVVEIIGAPLMPFALAVAFAASASFMSPYGYQTNLLAFNAADYKFTHFTKIGLPISIVYSSIVISLLNVMYF
ncbi:SLC13 family permease [Alteromonas sp. ASW11-130]|uniref:SLC13 family permease n=1 Tax=Alteromonas sp. ASW11-130 TaxID=3015775 RepID=UPI002242414D|nr:SLC13 family permease [Alteromonas sp. ASW11-130]MCW8093061.1 SLC13 family permease [Alteromonas sp. ASW11-130]